MRTLDSPDSKIRYLRKIPRIVGVCSCIVPRPYVRPPRQHRTERLYLTTTLLITSKQLHIIRRHHLLPCMFLRFRPRNVQIKKARRGPPASTHRLDAHEGGHRRRQIPIPCFARRARAPPPRVPFGITSLEPPPAAFPHDARGAGFVSPGKNSRRRTRGGRKRSRSQRWLPRAPPRPIARLRPRLAHATRCAPRARRDGRPPLPATHQPFARARIP